jgi:hypothetical protein
LLVHGRWFSPGTPASSTTKTGRHDIAEILLKVALNTKNKIKINPILQLFFSVLFSILSTIVCDFVHLYLITASDYPFDIFKLSSN